MSSFFVVAFCFSASLICKWETSVGLCWEDLKRVCLLKYTSGCLAAVLGQVSWMRMGKGGRGSATCCGPTEMGMAPSSWTGALSHSSSQASPLSQEAGQREGAWTDLSSCGLIKDSRSWISLEAHAEEEAGAEGGHQGPQRRRPPSLGSAPQAALTAGRFLPIPSPSGLVRGGRNSESEWVLRLHEARPPGC